jgi:folate-binding protein YgfZ
MILPPPIADFPWSPAAWLRVSGPDAAGFLQGQFTNDIRQAGPGQAVYGLWLNQKGKVVADSFVLRGRGEDEFWIGSYFSPAAVIRSRLEAFIVADDVILEDATTEWRGVTLTGGGTERWLAAESRAGFFFKGRRSSEESWEWVVPNSSWDAIRTELAGLPKISSPEMERRRIAAGIPAIPLDIGPTDLPNEGSLEVIAISSAKGCYLGQEVMARLKSRGKIRRQLHRVSGPGTPPSVPAPLWRETERAGELRSIAPDAAGTGWIGLAMLSLALYRPDLPLSLAAGGPPLLKIGIQP